MKKKCYNDCISDAHWYCKKCELSFCFDCVKTKDCKLKENDRYVYICPECRRMLAWIGGGNVVGPPGKNLLRSLLYPFSKHSFLVMALLSSLGFLFSDILLLNVLLASIIYFVIQYYSFDVIHHTMSGVDEPPKIDKFSLMNTEDDIRSVMIVKYFIFYLIFNLAFLIMTFQTFLGSTLISLLFLVVPSAVFPYMQMRDFTSIRVKKYWNPGLFSIILEKNLLFYPVVLLLNIPFFSMAYFMFCFPPVLVIPLVFYTMIVSHRLIGQMVIISHLELDYLVDYDAFKDKYTLESFYGFKS